MSAPGFSVGDFVSILQAIQKLHSAFSKSTPKYRGMREELEALNEALSSLSPNLEDVRLTDSARSEELFKIFTDCSEALEDVRHSIENYTSSRGNELIKLQIPGKRMDTLQEKVQSLKSTINAFLQTLEHPADPLFRLAGGTERVPVLHSLQSNEQYGLGLLPDPWREFRLVRLFQSSDVTKPVSYNLATFPLDNPPEYEALSYVWGRYDDDGHQVHVNGKSFTIRSNLNAALQRLRARFHNRWLWIDKLCINMQDLKERGAQVTVMKTVFMQARQVIVWLGEPLSDGESPTGTIAALDEFRNKQVWSPGVPKVLKDYSENFNNAWFTRVWAIQEYVLARTVLFLWGTDSANPSDLIAGVNFVADLLLKPDAVHSMQQEEIDEISSNLRGFRYFHWAKNAYNNQTDDVADFGRLVATAQELCASDPRDYVYGLLALAPSSLRDAFQPDYTLETDEMYLKLAEVMALATKTEAVLNTVALNYFNADNVATPTWVPGWVDELFLRVSDIVRNSGAPGSVQSAVVECLDILAILKKSYTAVIELSTSEKAVYAKILQDISGMLRALISLTESTQAVALTALYTDPTALHTVDDNFSDSGYSTASSAADQTSLLADGIAAHLLDDNFCQRLLVAAAKLEKRDETLARYLRPCIKQLGYELDALATDSIELSAARELKRHTPFIVRALITRLRIENLVEDEGTRAQRESRIARLLDEQASGSRTRLHDALVIPGKYSNADVNDTDKHSIAEYPSEGYPQQQMSKTALERIKEFISSDDAFIPFLYLLSRTIYSSPLAIVEAEMLHQLSGKKQQPASGAATAIFKISWDFNAFMQRENIYSEGRTDSGRLCNLLVISGTAKSSYATNCETYLRWRWPDTSPCLLSALCHCGEPETANSMPVAGQPKVRIHTYCGQDGMLVVDAKGGKRDLIEIAQQLTWLTAACRQARVRDVSLSNVLFFGTNQDAFRISTLPLKRVVQQDEACWISLFPGTVIAHEYPIPERGEETGMELPFHLMTTLAGPLYPMNYDGGFCLKAYSRILFPTAVTKSKTLCIQWHFDTKPGAQLTPPWHASKSDDWKWLKMLTPRQLVEARCFLGYCRRVVVDLGTEKSEEYYKNIQYSGLNNESHAPAAGMPSSITVSTAALLPIVLSTVIPIIKTKALSLAADLERDYEDILYETQSRPVILYDSGENDARGWMVPLSCVLLHMVHTWSASRATFTNGFPHLGQTSNAGKEARIILLKNWNFVVRKSYSTELNEDKVVRDLVMQFWKNICQKQYEDLLAMTQAEYSYELQTEKLYGWEYMDIVDGKYSLRKQVSFKTNWGLFREACIVIFGKNLGELIRPASDVSLCSKWHPVRTKRMYLTATIQCLTTLAYQNGGNPEILTSFRLTNKGYWHYKPRELFLDCPHAAQGKCLKMPQYLRSHAPQDTEVLVPPSEGAVVFGRKLLEKSKPAAEVSETGRSSSEQRHRFNLLARAKRSLGRGLDRVASGSTATTSSHKTNDPLLSDESAEDS